MSRPPLHAHGHYLFVFTISPQLTARLRRSLLGVGLLYFVHAGTGMRVSVSRCDQAVVLCVPFGIVCVCVSEAIG